jgi:DNA (cytosine-5)-methyltransferase 1
LRELIRAGQIAPGEVDERSIVDVTAGDVRGYAQAHFFAGIGVWSYALRCAGWDDERPVWTGSCPCQPFSNAGKRKGTADERHLWPEFYRLIAACKPTVVFGEQVASKDGRDWLAGVRADLEDVGYEVGAADLCAAGVGAPHIRQRLWWVANTNMPQQDGRSPGGEQSVCNERSRLDRMGNTDNARLAQRQGEPGNARAQLATVERASGERGGLGDSLGNDMGRNSRAALGAKTKSDCERCEDGACRFESGLPSEDVRLANALQPGRAEGWTVAGNGQIAWSSGDFIPCTDGKARRVESGVCPLAHGVSKRMGKLRGFGNAIVPQVAAEFISAFMEINCNA